VKDPFKREVDIDDLGILHLKQGQENPFRGLAHITVFHWWLAHHCSRIDRILLVRDTGNVKDRVVIGQRVIAGVIAERAFQLKILVDIDITLEYKLGIGGNVDVIHTFDDPLKVYKLGIEALGREFNILARATNPCDVKLDNCRTSDKKEDLSSLSKNRLIGVSPALPSGS
jgi:hypothetical protein